MNKLIVAVMLSFGLFLGPLQGVHEAQEEEGLGIDQSQPVTPSTMPKQTPSQRDILHLNTIGVFSAGFVLQSYGYIGVLADALSKGVYEPELVRSMLAETINYLKNVKTQLEKYDNMDVVSADDRKFIASIKVIIDQLIKEAEALSAFAVTKSKEDLDRFENARKEAWKNIKKTFGMS